MRFWLGFLLLCSFEWGGGEKKLVCMHAKLVILLAKKAERQDERSVKATSEILKAVVEMSAGKPWLLTVTEATREEARKKQRKPEWEREKNAQNKTSDLRTDTENSVFYSVVSLTFVHTALVLSSSFSLERTALNGNWTKLIKVSFSAALQRWMEHPQVKLCNSLWGFFSFHYLCLPKAVRGPSRLLIQYIFLLSFTV